MIWCGFAWYASLTKRLAYVQVGDLTIVAVNLRTGAARSLGDVPVYGAYQLVPNERATRLAGTSYDEGRACCPRLVVVDLQLWPISARQIPLPGELGPVLWLTGDRFAYFTRDEVLMFTSRLRRVAKISRWPASGGALVGSTMFGVDYGGALFSARPPHGTVRMVRHLPGSPELIVSATP
jgi:hypothetical protein